MAIDNVVRDLLATNILLQSDSARIWIRTTVKWTIHDKILIGTAHALDVLPLCGCNVH